MASKGQSMMTARILCGLLCLLFLQMICAQTTPPGAEDTNEDYLCGSGNHTWHYGDDLYIERCQDCFHGRMIYPTEILAWAGTCVGTTAFTRLMEDGCVGRKECQFRNPVFTEAAGLNIDQLRFELYVKKRKQCPPEMTLREGDFRGYLTVKSSDLPLEVKGECGQIQRVHASLKTDRNIFNQNAFSDLLSDACKEKERCYIPHPSGLNAIDDNPGCNGQKPDRIFFKRVCASKGSAVISTAESEH